jgi:hypothetical protein
MELKMPYMKDPKTGEPSVSLTLLITGFIIAALKLLTSGVDIGIVKLAVFSGGDFATVVGALAALYWARKNTDSHSGESK